MSCGASGKSGLFYVESTDPTVLARGAFRMSRKEKTNLYKFLEKIAQLSKIFSSTEKLANCDAHYQVLEYLVVCARYPSQFHIFVDQQRINLTHANIPLDAKYGKYCTYVYDAFI